MNYETCLICIHAVVFKKLQFALNTLARVASGTRKRDHTSIEGLSQKIVSITLHYITLHYTQFLGF